MSDSNSSSANVGFASLLTIGFIVLRLTNYIDWSWWLVLLPMYGPFILMTLVMFLLYVVKGMKK